MISDLGDIGFEAIYKANKGKEVENKIYMGYGVESEKLYIHFYWTSHTLRIDKDLNLRFGHQGSA